MAGYDFYFDESFHTRKITQTGNRLNIDLPNEAGFYFGCYVGSDDWQNLTPRLQEFEQQYRKKFDIPNGKELKSGTLLNKNGLQYGFASIKPISRQFYIDLFDLIQEKIKIHINILSKHEYLIRKVSPGPVWFKDNNVNYSLYLYNFTKFITLHPEYHIGELLISKSKSKQKREQIGEILLDHINIISGIKKKIPESNAVKDLYNVIYHYPFGFNGFKQNDWNYNTSIALFDEYLRMECIELHHLFIDNELQTEKAAKQKFNLKTSCVDSKNCLQIRLCDWVAGFVSKILYAYSANYHSAMTKKQDLSEDIYLLPEKSFIFDVQTVELIKKATTVLMKEQEGYTSVMTGAYFDDAMGLYCVLRYLHSCTLKNIKPTSKNYNLYLGIENYNRFESMQENYI